MPFEQLSLFTMWEETPAAFPCGLGEEAPAGRLEPWMLELVPDGEYIINIGKHAMVLRPAAVKANDIPEGHRYYHYTVGTQVYAGIFVARGEKD